MKLGDTSDLFAHQRFLLQPIALRSKTSEYLHLWLVALIFSCRMAATAGTLTFFERESWPSHERPYELLFQPPTSDFPVCNYKVVQVPNVPIHDLRPLKNKLSLDREGFLIADINTSMEYEDYFNQEKLKTTYMPKIKTFLKEKLGIRAAYIHECVVSNLESWSWREPGAKFSRSASRRERGPIQAALASPSPTFILVWQDNH